MPQTPFIRPMDDPFMNVPGFIMGPGFSEVSDDQQSKSGKSCWDSDDDKDSDCEDSSSSVKKRSIKKTPRNDNTALNGGSKKPKFSIRRHLKTKNS